MDNMTVRDAKVVAARAQGKSVRKAAKELSISPTTIQRVSSKHKDIIDTQQARLVEATLPVIIDRTIKEINHANTINPADKDSQAYLTRVDKKEENILKGVGIAPSHAPSIHIQNIYNDNSKTILSPMVADLLSGKLDNMTIDAEIVEESH